MPSTVFGRSVSVGVRTRAAFALALAALLVSIAVATLTYLVARTSLLTERRTVVQQLAFAEAIEVQNARASGDTDIAALLRRRSQKNLASVVFIDTAAYTSGESISARIVPSAFRDLVRPNKPIRTYAYQIVKSGGTTNLIVGVPLPVINGQYFGISSLTEVDKHLRDLARALAIAALLSTASAAWIGRAVIRRVLQPLADVAEGASQFAGGRLDTRIPLTGDADLDPLLVSFNDMAQSLQGRIEREARFASDVSHELRTPLTALVTAARLLDGRRDELGERSQRTLDVLVTQTQHFERLVLDLLEISRFDAGAAELHGEVVYLPDLLQNVVRMNGSDAELIADEFQPPEVAIDKRRVERMVANLLQNAANYAGGATRVELTNGPERQGGRRIVIAVDDEGPGVPPEEREVIFERFRRGASNQRSATAPKGTGLGLSLVRAHVNLHGGQVWVEERPGGGSRFVIDIAEIEVAE